MLKYSNQLDFLECIIHFRIGIQFRRVCRFHSIKSSYHLSIWLIFFAKCCPFTRGLPHSTCSFDNIINNPVPIIILSLRLIHSSILNCGGGIFLGLCFLFTFLHASLHCYSSWDFSTIQRFSSIPKIRLSTLILFTLTWC